MAGTSPTVVTTFVTALSVLRLVVATAPACGAITGASIAAVPVAEERRIIAGVAVGSVADEASCAGDGSPLAAAATGLSVACRRVAVLVGETSLALCEATTVPTAASAVCETFGKLGAPERRVSVGAAVGLVEVVGLSRPCERAIDKAGCERSAERGSAAGIVAGWAAVTCELVRWMRLASADASTAVAALLLADLFGDSTAAVVATSGRVVLRGWRLATGEGV